MSRPQHPLTSPLGHQALAHLQRVQNMLVQAARSTLLLSVGQLSSVTYSPQQEHFLSCATWRAVHCMHSCSCQNASSAAHCLPQHPRAETLSRLLPTARAASPLHQGLPANVPCPYQRGCKEVGGRCSLTFTLMWSIRHLRWGLSKLNTGDSLMASGKAGALLVQPSNSWLQPNLQQHTLLRGPMLDVWATVLSYPQSAI